MTPRARRLTWIAPLVVAALLGGCRAPGDQVSVGVAPGDYARAFDQTRDVLAEYRFTLERVDARAGVITTQPKATTGLATPWDRDQSSLRDEWADLVNEHERQVRVTFVPTGTGEEPADRSPEVDLRELDAPLEARFEVTVLQVSVPGRRIEPSAIGLSSRWTDPQMARRGVGPADRVPLRADDELAARLADALRRRLEASE
ncbi:MAG: hypothetical protein R3B57_13065 [Phycisphaerales bacterium]